jgi:15-cis-phytoene synthase
MSAFAREEALRRCEEITRHQAANFYYGIRLLPAAKREAMCAVYALARRIDDIGDGALDPARKQELLEAARRDVRELSVASPDPVIAALAYCERRFPLPREAFLDLIDGVGMDVAGTDYEHFDDLVLYCRRVAGSIGRLCLAIFGSRDPQAAEPLADDLGVAMQLTNILRDVREDALNGRVYLPGEDLRRFGWPTAGVGPEAVVAAANTANRSAPSSVIELVHFQANRNREWFERGIGLVPLLDRRSAACVLAMSGIYRRLLERIDAQPAEILQRRLSLPMWEKALVAARSAIGAAA